MAYLMYAVNRERFRITRVDLCVGECRFRGQGIASELLETLSRLSATDDLIAETVAHLELPYPQ